MPRTNNVPDSFADIEEAAEFWDVQSTADDWDQTHEVGFEIVLNPRHRVVVASDLAEQLRLLATQQGVSVETLVNLWLQERIQRSRDGVHQKQEIA